MKLFFSFLITAFLSIHLFAQSGVSTAAEPAGNVYAVIVGISNYLEPAIDPLQFANRDAEEFALFLKSEAGGSVPKENIQLLIDSSATTAAVYNAIYWLKKTCRENDLVYFYFSGHGDLENITMHKTGYLICYNSPAMNYIHMALSIEHLNDITNSLSVETKANVVLITDACHSGNLAGNKFKGNFLVGQQLMAVQQKEIRIASCTTDQLSNEKEDWGGGRGVFSYYFINGLKGLADITNDGIVTVGEIKKYLTNALATDPVLKRENTVQTPVLKGNDKFQLSKVVQSVSVSTQAVVNADLSINNMVLLSAAPVVSETTMEPEEYFFSILKKENLEKITDSLQLIISTVEEIPFLLISSLKLHSNDAALAKLNQLESKLKSDGETLKRFNGDLAVAFDDKGQDVIRQYINGDEAELERRRYYNLKNSGYDVYPKMFTVALKLTQSDNFFYNILKVKQHYFSGVALRLKIPVTENPTSLIEQALAEQTQALALEENAAYIYNELGILHQYKKENKEAEAYFIKATEYAPAWSIPHANLCGLYGSVGKFDKGIAACKVADSLQTNTHITNTNLGYLYEQSGNLLYAEEFNRNAIDINSRHFLPYENLGNIYLKTTDYTLADSFYYEADLRKQGFHFKGNEWMSTPASFVEAHNSQMKCPVDTQKLNSTDIFAFFTWGVQEYRKGNYYNAVRVLKKVIALDKKNPLVFHYLGKLYYDQQKWEEAEVMFKLAIQYYLNEQDFIKYTDSVIKSVTYPYDHSCFEKFFQGNYYLQVEDYYFAGTLYENWKHPEEAEVYFRKAIQATPEELGGYLKLWQLFEKLGRYTETEAIIKCYSAYDKELSERELNEFYRRTIDKFEFNGDWNYRLGLLLYSRAEVPSRSPYFDSIVWFPKINKELFVDFDLYDKFGKDDDLVLFDRSSTGAPAVFILDNIREIGRESFEIPGTKESIGLADAIYMPRKDGIKYLVKAAELLSEKETQGDINFKIGNIYVWAGSKKQAYPFYVKSIEFIPDNANARLHLVDVCKAIYKNREAMTQLNYLYDSSQINFHKRLLFAEFSIHGGEFIKATRLLNEAESIHPYVLPEFSDLRGRLAMLSNLPDNAIAFYKTFTKLMPKDPNVYYTLARIYAQKKQPKEAWEFLESAIAKGFNYSFILKTDPYLVEMRTTGKWNDLMKKITPKKYNIEKSRLRL